MIPKWPPCVCLKHWFPLLYLYLLLHLYFPEHSFLDITLKERELSPSADSDRSALLTRHSEVSKAEPHFQVAQKCGGVELCYQLELSNFPQLCKGKAPSLFAI